MKNYLLTAGLLFVSTVSSASDFKITGNSIENFAVGDIALGKMLPPKYLTSSERAKPAFAATNRNHCFNKVKERVPADHRNDVMAISNGLTAKITGSSFNNMDMDIPYQSPPYYVTYINPGNEGQLYVYYVLETLKVIGVKAKLKYLASSDKVVPLIKDRFGEPTLVVKAQKAPLVFFLYQYANDLDLKKLEKSRVSYVWMFPENPEGEAIDKTFWISVYSSNDGSTSVTYSLYKGVTDVRKVYHSNMELCLKAIEPLLQGDELQL
ncbi:hypothetical protein NMS00_002400 [Vibrio alginolyticus]|uniref:hypothetical protein n=1 Tax=Vibrio TaxID=662 RepID=UPI00187FE799|nr:hypothetical protein [Vibrio sp. OPT46]EJL6725098.1 hypothetical protein [Vibrio alginolyticus]ELA9085515.1 hypothetical protein [Vibrio alginolyticus]MBE8572079.1 hypothetical protein [Vibrio sp. OPT46]